MRTPRSLLLALLFLALPAAGSAQTSISASVHVGPSGRPTVDLGYFYDDLAPYGRWIERPQYGWVWRPSSVSSSWRPYEDGHWVWTDEGWTWMSDEPYGWATYHYGRWYDDSDYGWTWVPGDEWAPAWVSWQEGDDYLGWAPLPPSVSFRSGVTLNASLGPDAYVFVPENRFLAPRIVDYVVPRARYSQFFPRTRNVTVYRRVNNRIYNTGVPVDRIQRVVGRTVTRYQVADLGADSRHRGARVQSNRVAFFRPQVQRTRVAPPPERPRARQAVVAQRQIQQQARVQRQQVQQQAKVERRQVQQQTRIQKREVQQQSKVQQRQIQQQARVQRQQVQQQAKAQRQAQSQRQQARAQRQQAQRQHAQGQNGRGNGHQGNGHQGNDGHGNGRGHQKPPQR